MNTILTICTTLLLNHTIYPWNKHDIESLEHAKTRCVYYYSQSSCLKKFEKKGTRRYWATCGK